LQRLMRAHGDVANLIIQATIWRRIGIIELPDTDRIYDVAVVGAGP
jgi:hypothetical protein